MTDGHRRLAWFSCGAASAVAAKLCVETYGVGCEVVCCDTRSSEDHDNYRFSADVERWLGRPIVYIRSAKYTGVDDVIERRRYMSGVAGALCTVELKKFPREAFQQADDVHVFGYTAEERARAERFDDNNPSLRTEWLLIDRGVTKADTYRMLAEAGIEIPRMYRLGYGHNNCPGCVKATSPAYWNKIRTDYPDVFDRRCRQSRALGVKLVRIRGVRAFLDELVPSDEPGDIEDIDCGPACQLPLPF
jgi:hypothetical protein